MKLRHFYLFQKPNFLQHILPVKDRHRRFHRISYQGQLLQMMRLPFGLAAAPRIYASKRTQEKSVRPPTRLIDFLGVTWGTKFNTYPTLRENTKSSSDVARTTRNWELETKTGATSIRSSQLCNLHHPIGEGWIAAYCRDTATNSGNIHDRSQRNGTPEF